MRQVATTVGLDMMMGLVARTSVVLEKMTEHERLKEAARCVSGVFVCVRCCAQKESNAAPPFLVLSACLHT